jgi:putative flippase GtrA
VTRTRSARDLLAGLVRYGLVGLANAATYYGTYLLALPRAAYVVAHVVGLGVAMVVSFLLNCRFTFRVRPTWTRFLLYPASQTVNILATTVGVVALVHGGVDERLAPLVAAVLAMPLSFLAARFLITRAVSSPAVAAVVGTQPEVARTQATGGPIEPVPVSLREAVTLPMTLPGAGPR